MATTSFPFTESLKFIIAAATATVVIGFSNFIWIFSIFHPHSFNFYKTWV